MEQLEFKLILEYISAWMWHIIAIMMLGFSIMSLMNSKYIFFFSLLGVFVVAEFIAWQRKKSFEDDLEV